MEKKQGKIIKKLARVGLISLLVLLLLPLLLSLALLIPAVQERAVYEAVQLGGRYLKIELSLGSLYLEPFKTLRLQEVLIKDQQADTLLYVDVLRLDVTMIDLEKMQFAVDEVELRDAYFNLYKQQGDSLTNLQFLMDAFKSDEPDTSSLAIDITCDEVILDNIHFSYHDQNVSSEASQKVDFAHLNILGLSGKIKDVQFKDELEADISGLHFGASSGFLLRCLNAHVLLSDQEILANQLKLVTNRSILEGAYGMRFADFGAFSNFLDEVVLHLQLKESLLHFDDVAFFAPALKGLLLPLTATMEAQGSVSKLQAHIDSVNFGNGSRLVGDVSLRGLPDVETMIIQAKLAEVFVLTKDFEQLGIPTSNGMQRIDLPELVDQLGYFQYTGRFSGFVSDFVTYGSMKSQLGELALDINLKTGETISYTGKLKTDDFNLAALLGTDILGRTGFAVDVQGKDFEPKRMDVKVQGKLDYFDLNGYRFQRLSLDGYYHDKIAEGSFSLNDPNGLIDFTGEVDLNEEIPHINCATRITDLYLGRTKIIPADTFGLISSDISLAMSGGSLDELSGTLLMEPVVYENSTHRITVDSVVLRDKGKPGAHSIELNTDIARFSAQGNVSIAQLPETFLSIIDHYAPDLIGFQVAHYAERQMDFELTIDNNKDLVNLIDSSLKVNAPIQLKGAVRSADHYFSMTMDTLDWRYGNLSFDGMGMHVSPVEGRLATSVSTKSFSANEDFFLEKLRLEAFLLGDSLKTMIEWDNATAQADSGRVELMAYQADDFKYNLELQHLFTRIGGTVWQSEKVSTLRIDSGRVRIANLDIRSDKGLITCNGSMNSGADDFIRLDVDGFDLSYLSAFGFLKNDIEGQFAGEMLLSEQEGFFMADSRLDVDSLRIDGISVGKVAGRTNYFGEQRALNLALDIAYAGEQNLKLIGDIYPFKETEQLDLDLELKALRTAVVEPFIGEYLSGISGEVNGSVSVGGELAAPELRGAVMLNSFEGKVNYLNAVYQIPEARIDLSDGFIGMDYAPVIDEKGEEAHVTATVFHESFKNINYDIFINAENFLGLNTTIAQNESYYGRANLTGDIGISGYPGETSITIEASTDKNTQLSIPLASDDEVSDLEYIRFIPPKGSEKVVNKQDVLSGDVLGLNLDFQLSVNDNAEVQIIFDQKIGDIIKVRGTGDMLMKIDNRGTFNMYGDYTIKGGDYLFTLQNALNKRFTVQPGSKITWNGAPTEAKIDLTAAYSLRAAPINLTASVGDTSEIYKKRMPVDVYLSMKGDLLEPVITFDVELPSLPESDIANQLLAPSTTSEQDMNQQVFALLLTQNFFTQGSGISALSGAGQNTTYEMVSNQFSNWISQYFENVDVGVMVGNQTELNLSTELLNDRVLVELNGSVQGQDGAQDNSNNFAGEFNIEYKINQDGSLRARVFNEANNYNPTNLNQSPYTQGMGVFYRKEFDTFGGLIRSIFKRNKK